MNAVSRFTAGESVYQARVGVANYQYAEKNSNLLQAEDTAHKTLDTLSLQASSANERTVAEVVLDASQKSGLGLAERGKAYEIALCALTMGLPNAHGIGATLAYVAMHTAQQVDTSGDYNRLLLDEIKARGGRAERAAADATLKLGDSLTDPVARHSIMQDGYRALVGISAGDGQMQALSGSRVDGIQAVNEAFLHGTYKKTDVSQQDKINVSMDLARLTMDQGLSDYKIAEGRSNDRFQAMMQSAGLQA